MTRFCDRLFFKAWDEACLLRGSLYFVFSLKDMGWSSSVSRDDFIVPRQSVLTTSAIEQSSTQVANVPIIRMDSTRRAREN